MLNFAKGLLCALILCLGATSASAEFVWNGMHSRFAADYSQTAEQCRKAAARLPDDPFTNALGAELCPGLQRMVQAGQCDPVGYDLRGHEHHLMGLQQGGQTAAAAGARVSLPWRPEALICEFGESKSFVFVATIYVGHQPNGQPACHNVAIDYIPIKVLKRPEAIPVTVEHVKEVSRSGTIRWDIPLGLCVPNIVRYLINRRRF